MIIATGSDHEGVYLKQASITPLKELQHNVLDAGAYRGYPGFVKTVTGVRFNRNRNVRA